MSAEGNDFVATATAEKRLREVLAERFPHHTGGLVDELAETLLKDAEITYLPRKRSVSILLRYPEKAAPNGKVTVKETVDFSDEPVAQDKQAYDEAQLSRVYSEGQPVMTPEQGAVTVQPETPAEERKRVARFGEFQPTVTSAPEYHEDDYFTE